MISLSLLSGHISRSAPAVLLPPLYLPLCVPHTVPDTWSQHSGNISNLKNETRREQQANVIHWRCCTKKTGRHFVCLISKLKFHADTSIRVGTTVVVSRAVGGHASFDSFEESPCLCCICCHALAPWRAQSNQRFCCLAL